jgi:hypothetical protein
VNKNNHNNRLKRIKNAVPFVKIMCRIRDRRRNEETGENFKGCTTASALFFMHILRALHITLSLCKYCICAAHSLQINQRD